MIDFPTTIYWLQWFHILKVWTLTHKFVYDGGSKLNFITGAVLTFFLNEIGSITVSILSGTKLAIFTTDWFALINVLVFAFVWLESNYFPLKLSRYIYSNFLTPLSILNEFRRAVALIATLHSQFKQDPGQTFIAPFTLAVISTTFGGFVYPVVERNVIQPKTNTFISEQYAIKLLLVPIIASGIQLFVFKYLDSSLYGIGAVPLIALLVVNKINLLLVNTKSKA